MADVRMGGESHDQLSDWLVDYNIFWTLTDFPDNGASLGLSPNLTEGQTFLCDHTKSSATQCSEPNARETSVCDDSGSTTPGNVCEQPAEKRSEKSGWLSFRHRWWHWEVVALATCAVSMVAIIVTLAMIDQHSLDSWPFPIQPNSLISVFMAVGKAALLVPVAECISQAKWIQFSRSPRPLALYQVFDEASRGPWGSLQQLLKPKGMGAIALVGSALTIVSLGLDPFTQQILEYPSREIPQMNETATFARTRLLDSDESKMELQGAVMNGIYGSESSPSTHTCTTSKCDWHQPITSIGVCSYCKDITSSVDMSCKTEPGPIKPKKADNWTFNQTNCTNVVNSNITFNTYIQTLKLPGEDGREAEYANEYTDTMFVLPGEPAPLGDLVSQEVDWLTLMVAYKTFFNYSAIGMPEMNLKRLDPEVSICGLYWCGQTFNTPAFRNGDIENKDPSATQDLHVVIDQHGQPAFWETNEAHSKIYAVPKKDRTSFPGNPYFTVNYSLVSSLEIFFADLFKVLVTLGNDDFHSYPDDKFGTKTFTDAVFQKKNISDTFVRVARSMSEQIRASNDGEAIRGIPLGNETYMKVRWAWLALPLAIFIGAIGLLTATMIINAREGVLLWKSSTLAVLLHDFVGHRRGDVSLDSLQDVEALAKAEVKLEPKMRLFADCT